jgi:hypothetical protein
MTRAMKRAPRKDAVSALAKPARAASGPRLRVRMYRQGLGDCFLISLLGRADRDFHLMIDCGVILGTPDAAARLRAVIGDIIRETGGQVDVLAVTHEHYDHVAGFVLAQDLFATPEEAPSEPSTKLATGEVWFAWTEDPDNADATRLRTQRAARVTALAALAARVSAMAPPARAATGVLDADGASLPGVFTALRFLGVAGDGSGQGATAQAMQNAKALAPRDKVAYRKPGEVVTLAQAPGVRIFILGPPSTEAALRRTDSATEVYHLDSTHLEDSVRIAAGSGGGPWDDFAPFDPAWSRRLSAISDASEAGPLAAFLRERYYGPKDASPATDLSWRRIDADWLSNADELALALDNSTNNTSLAFAIELTGSGDVLLFPADAQVGNLLSWQDVRWPDAPDITADDLLRRTVFYKVGHHGSHNATLKAKELERMPAAGLTAFIPVDQAMAMKKGWAQMPLPALLDALRARCGERVVRIDEALPAGLADLSEGPAGGPFGTLFHEWTVRL